MPCEQWTYFYLNHWLQLSGGNGAFSRRFALQWSERAFIRNLLLSKAESSLSQEAAPLWDNLSMMSTDVHWCLWWDNDVHFHPGEINTVHISERLWESERRRVERFCLYHSQLIATSKRDSFPVISRRIRFSWICGTSSVWQIGVEPLISRLEVYLSNTCATQTHHCKRWHTQQVLASLSVTSAAEK